MMTNPQQPPKIEPEAVRTLVAFWLEKAANPSAAYHQNAGHAIDRLCAAAGLRHREPDLDGSTGFYAGAQLAIDVVCAVLSDPLGDPAPAIAALCDKMRTDVKGYMKAAA